MIQFPVNTGAFQNIHAESGKITAPATKMIARRMRGRRVPTTSAGSLMIACRIVAQTANRCKSTSAIAAKPRRRLTTPLIVKNARFTRLRSSARTIRFSTTRRRATRRTPAA